MQVPIPAPSWRMFTEMASLLTELSSIQGLGTECHVLIGQHVSVAGSRFSVRHCAARSRLAQHPQLNLICPEPPLPPPLETDIHLAPNPHTPRPHYHPPPHLPLLLHPT